jgi:hypothetical protein
MNVDVSIYSYYIDKSVTPGTQPASYFVAGGVSPTWGGISGTLSNQTDLSTYLNTLQPLLNGTGFVKASGTSISYDNNTYLTTSGTAYDSARLGGALANTYAPLASPAFTGSGSWDTPTFYVDAANHRVGFGTSAPLTLLEIKNPYVKTNTSRYDTFILSTNEATASNPFGLIMGSVGAAAQANRFWYIQTQEIGLTNSGNLCLQAYGGNVGIGTTAPVGLLSVGSNNGVYVDAANNNVINFQGSVDANAGGWINYRGYNGSTTRFRNLDIGDGKQNSIATFDGVNARVGIGTTTPGSLLSVGNVAGGSGTPIDGNILSSALAYGTGVGSSLTFNMYVAGGNSNSTLAKIQPIIYQPSRGYNNALDFFVGAWNNNADPGNAIMSLQSSGNVGIGTTSPDKLLTLTDSGSIGSVTFSTGYAGAGWNNSYASSKHTLEVDNLIVRNLLRAYDFEVDKIDVIGGSLVISPASGTVTGIASTNLYFDNNGGVNPIQFKTGDYIKAQQWVDYNHTQIAYYFGHVTDDSNKASGYITMDTVSGAWVGMRCSQWGSSTDSTRQNMLYMTSSDTNNPYIEGHTGVSTGVLNDTTRSFRLGNLVGITDPAMGALTSYGLYSQNAYLTGRLVLPTAGMTNEGSTSSDIRIYAGDTYANRATASFRVTQGGSLTAIGTAELGTAPASDGSYTMNVALKGYEIWENTYAGDGGYIAINKSGYNAGASYYRTTLIGDGKGNNLAMFTGLTNKVTINGGLTLNTTTKALTVPVMNGTQKAAISSPTNGMIIYDTTANQFAGYVGGYWQLFTMH